MGSFPPSSVALCKVKGIAEVRRPSDGLQGAVITASRTKHVQYSQFQVHIFHFIMILQLSLDCSMPHFHI